MLVRAMQRWPAVGAGMLAAAMCSAAAAVPWTIQLRDSTGQPLVDAAVAVEIRGLPAKASAGTVAQMGQHDKQFSPLVLVVQTGTAVLFPNFDTVRHHVYSFSPIKSFDLKLYSGTPAEPVVFDKPGVAELGCNIHDRMSAHIVVVDTPQFGKTDAQGQLKLDLPPGDHTLRLWHARLAAPALLGQALHVTPTGGQSTISPPLAR